MRYAKFFAAIATAGLEAAQTALPLSTTWRGWVTIGLALAGAVAVFAIPNVTPPVPAPTKDAA